MQGATKPWDCAHVFWIAALDHRAAFWGVKFNGVIGSRWGSLDSADSFRFFDPVRGCMLPQAQRCSALDGSMSTARQEITNSSSLPGRKCLNHLLGVGRVTSKRPLSKSSLALIEFREGVPTNDQFVWSCQSLGAGT